MMCRTFVVFVALSVFSAFPLRAADPAAKDAKPKTVKKAAVELVLPAKKVTFLDAKHFVCNWLLLGPIRFGESDFGGNEQNASIDKEFVSKEADLDGTQEAPKGAKWEAKDFSGAGGIPGEIDLGLPEHAVMYAVTWVNCPEELNDVKLMVGSDDYIKVWINGKLMHTYKETFRGGEADQDVVSGVKLQKGENRVVVKCVNVGGAWNFYLRFADKDDKSFVFKAAAPEKKTP